MPPPKIQVKSRYYEDKVDAGPESRLLANISLLNDNPANTQESNSGDSAKNSNGKTSKEKKNRGSFSKLSPFNKSNKV